MGRFALPGAPGVQRPEGDVHRNQRDPGEFLWDQTGSTAEPPSFHVRAGSGLQGNRAGRMDADSLHRCAETRADVFAAQRRDGRMTDSRAPSLLRAAEGNVRRILMAE